MDTFILWTKRASNCFQQDSPLHFEMFELGGGMARHFLELGGEMSYAAVVHLKSDLCKGEFIINE